MSTEGAVNGPGLVELDSYVLIDAAGDAVAFSQICFQPVDPFQGIGVVGLGVHGAVGHRRWV